MKFVTVRDFQVRPSHVWTKLAQERDLILTSNGKPIAILSAVSEETLEESLRAVRRARAMASVKTMQSHSIAAGTDQLTPNEIQAEISGARKARRR